MENFPQNSEKDVFERLGIGEQSVLRAFKLNLKNLIEDVQDEGYEDLEEDMRTIYKTIGNLNDEETARILQKKADDFAPGLNEDRNSKKFADSLGMMKNLLELLP
jgi:uncharacterized protein YjgD (DUF1641 family)